MTGCYRHHLSTPACAGKAGGSRSVEHRAWSSHISAGSNRFAVLMGAITVGCRCVCTCCIKQEAAALAYSKLTCHICAVVSTYYSMIHADCTRQYMSMSAIIGHAMTVILVKGMQGLTSYTFNCFKKAHLKMHINSIKHLLQAQEALLPTRTLACTHAPRELQSPQ